MSFKKKRHGVARRARSVLTINSAKGPKSPDAVPGNLLRMDLATRITTQRLHYRSGEEETAAESVHMLFPGQKRTKLTPSQYLKVVEWKENERRKPVARQTEFRSGKGWGPFAATAFQYRRSLGRTLPFD